jgi:hypothetical protein
VLAVYRPEIPTTRRQPKTRSTSTALRATPVASIRTAAQDPSALKAQARSLASAWGAEARLRERWRFLLEEQLLAKMVGVVLGDGPEPRQCIGGTGLQRGPLSPNRIARTLSQRYI